MKHRLKRVQFIHRTNDGICTKVWQHIDSKNMITIEHLWKNITQHLDVELANTKWRFCYYETGQVLPVWYHVDLLNDNDQIIVEDSIQSASSTVTSTPIQSVRLKSVSKKKQLNTHITNRSFIITNKYSIPNVFYQQWEEGKVHKSSYNCQMVF